MKNFFNNVGSIRLKNKYNQAVYTIGSIKDITNVIIPHFTNYPLITKKNVDFILFKSVVELINKDEHLTLEGLNKIINIKASINKGLSDKLNNHIKSHSIFNINPVDKPITKVPNNISFNWLAGFVCAEGSFYVTISKNKKSKNGHNITLGFDLAQHYRDLVLMKKIHNHLTCGNLKIINFTVIITTTKLIDILNKIIPLFQQYNIQGKKLLDFLDFCKIAIIMKEKKHLTNTGLLQIKKIKLGMNKNRK